MTEFKDKVREQIRASRATNPWDAKRAAEEMMGVRTTPVQEKKKAITQAAANEAVRYTQTIIREADIELSRIARRNGVSYNEVQSEFKQELKRILGLIY